MVTVLNWSKQRLTDKTLSEMLDGLEKGKKVHKLNLSNNQLESFPDLSEREQFYYVQKVDVSWNCLPKVDSPNIPIRVTKLDLSYNKLESIPDLKHLQQLNTLNLNDNKITSIGSTNLPAVKQLFLNNNELDGTVDGEDIPSHIKRLELGRNNLRSLINFSELTELETLSVENNALVEIPKMPTVIHDLDASNNSIKKFPDLSKMKLLRNLNLENNMIDYIPVGPCNPLDMEYVNLKNNPVTTLDKACFTTKASYTFFAEGLSKDQISHLHSPPAPVFERGYNAVCQHFNIQPQGTKKQGNLSKKAHGNRQSSSENEEKDASEAGYREANTGTKRQGNISKTAHGNRQSSSEDEDNDVSAAGYGKVNTDRLSKNSNTRSIDIPNVSDVTLCALSNRIGDSWKTLGFRLGFEEKYLSKIEDKPDTEASICMLKTWRRRIGDVEQLRKEIANHFMDINADHYGVINPGGNPNGNGLVTIFAMFTGELTGYKKDVNTIETFFKETIGYEIKTYKNTCREEFMNALEEIQKKLKNKEYDRYLMFILSHGGVEGINTCKKGSKIEAEKNRRGELVTVKMNTILESFYHDKVPGMKDYPKCFFIQACQGTEETLAAGSIPHKNDDSVETVPIALETVPIALGTDPIALGADILECYACTPRHVSFVRSMTGSVYIQKLFNVLRQDFQHRDFYHILTEVNRQISVEEIEYKKRWSYQMPRFISTLTKALVFRPCTEQVDDSLTKDNFK